MVILCLIWFLILTPSNSPYCLILGREETARGRSKTKTSGGSGKEATGNAGGHRRKTFGRHETQLRHKQEGWRHYWCTGNFWQGLYPRIACITHGVITIRDSGDFFEMRVIFVTIGDERNYAMVWCITRGLCSRLWSFFEVRVIFETGYTRL